MRPEKVFFGVLTLTSILLAQTGAEYIWDGSEWLWKEKESLLNTSDDDEIDGSGENIPHTTPYYYYYDEEVTDDVEDYNEEDPRDVSGEGIPKTTIKPGKSNSGAVANPGGNGRDESHLNLPTPTVLSTTRTSEWTTTTNNLVHGLGNNNATTAPETTSSSSASISAEARTAVVTRFGVLCAVLCVMFVAY